MESTPDVSAQLPRPSILTPAVPVTVDTSQVPSTFPFPQHTSQPRGLSFSHLIPGPEITLQLPGDVRVCLPSGQGLRGRQVVAVRTLRLPHTPESQRLRHHYPPQGANPAWTWQHAARLQIKSGGLPLSLFEDLMILVVKLS